MRKTREEKAITLIALIITIVVLLILAVVAINAVTGDGIIQHAVNAKTDYEKAEEQEQSLMQEYLGYLEKNTNGFVEIKNAKNRVLSTKTNTNVVDEYGNKIVVPAGFMIKIDDTTNNADSVAKGIVIEDCTETVTKGSQFVWIPVGKIYTNKEKTSSQTITLGRYTFSDTDGTPTLHQPTEDCSYTDNIGITIGEYIYTEYSKNATTANNKAKDISSFITSTNSNGGYYIGRYEAGDSSSTLSRGGYSDTSTEGTLVCKNNQIVYNWILQADASEKCQNMYKNTSFSSDLINGYAWDTAIVFIQTFSLKSGANNYANLNESNSIKKTGESGDEHCNINDMSGNVREWSTETTNSSDYPCVPRGGFYHSENSAPKHNTKRRGYVGITSSEYNAFRPILYI